MKTKYVVWLALGGLCGGACVVDKQLGETDGDDGAADGAASDAGQDGDDDDDGPGNSSSVTAGDDDDDDDDDAPGDPTTGPDDDDDDDDDTPGDPTTGPDDDDDDDKLFCADWTPPPFDCESGGDANFFFSGGLLTDLDDEVCVVTAVIAGDADVETFELDCDGDEYSITLESSNPHLPVPFDGGQQVRVTAVDPQEFFVFGQWSFSIRTLGGDLLLGYINENDHDPDVDLEPIEWAVGSSGCPAYNGAVICDAGGFIATQPVPVEFGSGRSPIVLFGGFSEPLVAPTGYEVIVEEATRIHCWDDDCAGDESGPHDRVQFLVVATDR